MINVGITPDVKSNIGIMMTTEDKQSLRGKLLNTCIVIQQFVVDDFTKRIKSLTESEGLGNEEGFDNSNIARNSANTAEINALNAQLEFADKELELLEKLKTTAELERDRVALGAVVVTNHYTFFISTSIEKFTVDEHVYFGISTSSPLYQSMAGRSKGESFVFNKTKYKIKDIF